MAALGQQPAANADPLADFKAPAASLPLLEELLLKKDVSSAVMIFDAEMIVPVGDITCTLGRGALRQVRFGFASFWLSMLYFGPCRQTGHRAPPDGSSFSRGK